MRSHAFGIAARLRLPVAALAVLAVLASAIACGSATAPATTEFIVHVDSVSGATAVSGGIYANQQLWGVVGPAGCTSFKEVRTSRVNSTMDVTVIGERD